MFLPPYGLVGRKWYLCGKALFKPYYFTTKHTQKQAFGGKYFFDVFERKLKILAYVNAASNKKDEPVCEVRPFCCCNVISQILGKQLLPYVKAPLLQLATRASYLQYLSIR